MNCEEALRSCLGGYLIFGIGIYFNFRKKVNWRNGRIASAGNLFLSYFCRNISVKACLLILPTQASEAREPGEPIILTAHCLLSRWFLFILSDCEQRETLSSYPDGAHTQQTNYQLIIMSITWHCPVYTHSSTLNTSGFPPGRLCQ